jgi:phosphoribosylanthranilate isomerase
MSMRTRIKFCGIQSEADAAASVQCGVDAIGFIFAPSPRRIELADAERIAATIPAFVSLVGVFVDHDEAEVCEILKRIPNLIPQFCGAEAPEYCERVTSGGPYLKVAHVAANTHFSQEQFEQYRGMLVFDTQHAGMHGGTGKAFDWAAFAPLSRPFVVAGGLNPDNVATAIATLRPYAVDVRSGIERDGRKDIDKMRAFIRAVRQVDMGVLHGT